jgi:hypothetical protein
MKARRDLEIELYVFLAWAANGSGQIHDQPVSSEVGLPVLNRVPTL